MSEIKKKTDFDVMNEMSANNMDISMCGDIVQSQVAKGGGKVTVGVPEKIHHIIANQLFTGNTTHYVALYIVNKEQFDKLRNS